MSYVYILKSLKDHKKYIGSTINLERRLRQHNNGEVRSTKFRRPLILIAYQYCNTISEATLYEKKYKRSHEFLERRIKYGLVKLVTIGE